MERSLQPPPAEATGSFPQRGAYEVLAVASRALLLEQVRERPAGVDTATLARITGLHPNTVRFHLDVLAEAGLVSVGTESAGKPGRPRLVYTANRMAPPPASDPAGTPQPVMSDGYALLADVLMQHLARISKSPGSAAEDAGRLWMSEHPAAGGLAASDADAVAQVTALLDALGFGPEPVRDREGWRILLHRCPFHALAAEHPELVCRLHLGLLQGAVNRLGRPDRAVRLQPFVAPGLCEVFVPLTELHR